MLIAMLLTVVLLASSAFAQQPSCEDERAALAEYVQILARERAQAQGDLAQARAEASRLKTQVEALKKAAEKPKEEKK